MNHQYFKHTAKNKIRASKILSKLGVDGLYFIARDRNYIAIVHRETNLMMFPVDNFCSCKTLSEASKNLTFEKPDSPYPRRFNGLSSVDYKEDMIVILKGDEYSRK